MKQSILVVIILVFLMGCSQSNPTSDHYDGQKFHNPLPDPNYKKNILSFIKWDKNELQPWPRYVENTDVPVIPNHVNKNETYITFINHSTQLIQLNQLNMITDPVFAKRASPFSWIGPKRVREPGIALKDLPKIDIVLISHNHYDHFDIKSLRKLNKTHQPLFIVPLKNAHILKWAGIDNVIELDWWQTYQLDPNNAIMLVPAQHWSMRSLTDINHSLWGGYYIKADDLKILFAGDTGYGNHIQQIYDRLGKMDVCLFPIGSYDHHLLMKYNHLNPDQAVKAHLAMRSELSLGMHYGTFQLSAEGYDEPVNRLKIALTQHHVDDKQFIAPGNGYTTHYMKK